MKDFATTLLGLLLGTALLMIVNVFFGGALLLFSTLLWPLSWVSAFICASLGMIATAALIGKAAGN